MVAFLKENGFPMTIYIKTEEFEDRKEGFKGYESIITDENNKEIAKFVHKNMRDRVHWVNGFFRALRMIIEEGNKDTYNSIKDIN